MARTHTNKKDIPQHCSVCGKIGHKSTFHKIITEKKCTTCGNVFPITEFNPQRYKNRPHYIGFSSTCKQCVIKECRGRYEGSFKGKLTSLLCSTRAKCRKQGIAFDITIDYLLDILKEQKELCWYSGTPLTYERGWTGVSIDRKNPSEGYTRDNIVLTNWRVNNMKSNLTDREFVEICKSIATRTR